MPLEIRQFRRIFAVQVLSCLVGAACVNCTSEPETTGPELEESIEIFSWWTVEGEAEALGALIEIFERAHDVSVTNAAAVDPTRARERLRERMLAGEPPDSFQAISGVDLLGWADEGYMTDLSALAEGNQLADSFPKPVLDVLTSDGALYAVPVNIERDNNLYFSPRMLMEANIQAPASLEDFYSACATLEQDGIIPLATPAAGWVMALLLFENLLPGLHGGAPLHR